MSQVGAISVSGPANYGASRGEDCIGGSPVLIRRDVMRLLAAIRRLFYAFRCSWHGVRFDSVFEDTRRTRPYRAALAHRLTFSVRFSKLLHAIPADGAALVHAHRSAGNRAWLHVCVVRLPRDVGLLGVRGVAIYRIDRWGGLGSEVAELIV